jgi:hypothetical protein
MIFQENIAYMYMREKINGSGFAWRIVKKKFSQKLAISLSLAKETNGSNWLVSGD